MDAWTIKKPAVAGGLCGCRKTVGPSNLHADSCRAVQGTVMMAVVDVVDERH
jgi:hypothetical protein